LTYDGDTLVGRMTACSQPIQQGMQAAGLGCHVQPFGGHSRIDQEVDCHGAGAVKLVVDLLVDGPLLGIDQRMASELARPSALQSA
jgi:hypothetical protein